MVVHKLLRVFAASLFVASCGRAAQQVELTPPRANRLQLYLAECDNRVQPAGAVCFRAKNQTDMTLTVWFSVEALYDGEWTEVATSTFADDPPKAARLVNLQPHAEQVLSWSPVAAQLARIAMSDFRIRANIKSPETVTAPIVTEAFRIALTAPR